MKPEFTEGDILIRRVSNGWVVFCNALDAHTYGSPEGILTLVYEESDVAFDEPATFIRLLRENFPDIIQSKKCGGVKLEVAEKGYGEE